MAERGSAGGRKTEGVAAERSRLRARALSEGAGALDARELVALVLGGPAGVAGERAEVLLGGAGLVELSRASALDLVRCGPLDRRGAVQVAAAFELGRRVERSRHTPRTPLGSAERVYRVVAADLRGLERETFMVLLLDGKHRLRRRERVSEGTLTTSLVHPREVYRAAVREAAAAVICVHNHPSGDPEPSPEDLEVTRRLLRVGRLLGIPLLDHVVVGDHRYVSIRARMPFR